MAKIHIKTYGCSANHADSESLAYFVKNSGHELTPKKEADVLIINTCTVKTPTENKILNYLRKLKKSGKKVIVCGCIPQAENFPVKMSGTACRCPRTSRANDARREKHFRH